MTGHINDRTLDHLLDGSINDADEQAIEEHVRRCNRCAHRLREWELLFPQIRNVFTGTVSGEPSVAFAAGGATAATPAPAVFVPEWTPPPSATNLPVRLAWGLVAVLAVAAGWLLVQRVFPPAQPAEMAYLPEPSTVATLPAGDSEGMGSGIPSLSESPAAASPARDTASFTPASLPPAQPAATAGTPPVQQPAADPRTPPVPREEPVRFPIRDDPAPRETQPAASAPDLPPLTDRFTRVTLGDALGYVNGTIRRIEGLTPEAVEVAKGSALPGADPTKAVVRVVYDTPDGRLILDQQRLNRPGRREPSISINTSPSGVSVAQWVDRGGYWISLAGRADQQTLLAIANRIR